jgi:hypothetical protein
VLIECGANPVTQNREIILDCPDAYLVTASRLHRSNRHPMALHPGYAATRISSNLNGSTKQFGWLQASGLCNQLFFHVNKFPVPGNDPNL